MTSRPISRRSFSTGDAHPQRENDEDRELKDRLLDQLLHEGKRDASDVPCSSAIDGTAHLPA